MSVLLELVVVLLALQEHMLMLDKTREFHELLEVLVQQVKHHARNVQLVLMQMQPKTHVFHVLLVKLVQLEQVVAPNVLQEPMQTLLRILDFHAQQDMYQVQELLLVLSD
jgi:hypothetical protein